MRRLLLAVAAALVMGVLAAPPVPAQQTSTAPSAPATAPGVSLVSQTAWVPLHDTFSMTLHLDDRAAAARPNAAIAIRVHQTTPSRSSFDAVIANQDLGSVLSQPDAIPIASLHPSARHNVTLTFGLSGSDVQPSIPISRPGVYPVEVSLVSDVPSGSFVTWLVTVDTSSEHPVDQPLRVSFVWQLTEAPLTQPDGTPIPPIAAEMKPHGRLDRVVSVLDAARGFPVSAVVSPQTAEAWAALADDDKRVAPAFNRLRQAVAAPSLELMPVPYVPIDIPALERAQLGGLLADEYATGAQTLHDVLGTAPSDKSQAAFVDPASDPAVDRLRGMLNDRVAVRDGVLVPMTHPFTPAQTFVLDTVGGRSRAAATAPFVEDLFDGHDSGALKAQRVVAALAEVAYEQPGIARGLVIAPPARWSPNVTMMNAVISALKDNPLVQPVTLDQFFTQVSSEQANGFDVERRLLPAAPPLMPFSASEYDAATQQVEAYRDVVGPNDPVVAAGERALKVALSTSITPEQAHALFTQLDNAVQTFERSITTDAKRVTLTSRRAKIPLSFMNSLKPERAVEVRVHLDSPKLTFPDGNDQIVRLKPGNNTIPFTVEARASGTFPMTITLTSANGKLAFGEPVRVTVRSAVFGHLAVAITIAAIAFLALWWANHLRRTRRGRRISSTTAPVT